MKRDKKGRFTSEADDNKGYKFTLTFPSLKIFIFWALILIHVNEPTFSQEIRRVCVRLNFFFPMAFS